MQLDHLPQEVLVTIFMEGHRTGVARTGVFRFHLSTFEEAFNIDLRPELTSSRYVTYGHQNDTFNRLEPLNLSYAEGDKADLQAVEQRHYIRRCYTCGNTKHLRPYCPLRKSRQY